MSQNDKVLKDINETQILNVIQNITVIEVRQTSTCNRMYLNNRCG